MRKGIVVQKKSMRAGAGVRKPKLTEVARRDRAKKMRLIWIRLSGVFVFGIFGYFFFFSPFAEIRHVSVGSQPVSVSGEEVLSVIRAYEEEKRWFIFSKKNFFFFSCAELRDRLEDRFITFSHIVVAKKFPDTISVSFSERAAAVNWCGRGRCFLLDREGYAFGELADPQSVESTVNVFPTLVDESVSDAAMRRTLASETLMRRVTTWDDFFRSRLGTTSGALYFVEPEKFEEYHIRTDRGWDVRVGKDIPIEETMNAFFAFLQTLPPDRQEKLESIDLRVSGKIFFTEKKDASTEVIAQSTEDGTRKENGKEKEKKKKGE